MCNDKKNIRNISFFVLFDVLINKKLLNNTINRIICNNCFSDKDKSFIKRECTGVIEKLNEIDDIIIKYSKVNITKLDKTVLIILRIAVYEILYMDKVPDFATINEAVNLTKKLKNKAIPGYVNGVLRNISRNKIIRIDDDLKSKKCYFKVFNDKEIDVLTELKNKNILYKKYTGKLLFKFAKVYYTNKYKNIIDTNNFKDGNVIIEDASSIYLVDRLVCYLKEMGIETVSILDTCSSPGGKIFSLIDLVKNDFKKIYAEARDISDVKIQKMKKNAKRLNLSNLNYKVNDATIYNKKDNNKFDVVLCDVPCTGLGVINKKPDIILNYCDKKRNELVKIQRKILNVCKNYVKINGLISYSTCTTTKEENEENTINFLNNNTNFKKMYEKRITIGDDNEADGFYMAIMKKISE